MDREKSSGCHRVRNLPEPLGDTSFQTKPDRRHGQIGSPLPRFGPQRFHLTTHLISTASKLIVHFGAGNCNRCTGLDDMFDLLIARSWQRVALLVMASVAMFVIPIKIISQSFRRGIHRPVQETTTEPFRQPFFDAPGAEPA